MSHRIYWIDNLKGFIILMVCFFHFDILCPFSIITGREALPVFFFLSGYLFCTNKYSTFKNYFNSKFKLLLLPYLTLSVLFALFPPSLKNEPTFANEWISSFHLPLIIEKYINTYIINSIDIINGYSFQQGTSPLWFVYTLFQVSIIYYIINKIPNLYLRFVCIIGSLCIGWYCNTHSIILPLHINTMFTSLFFFGLGQYSRIYTEKESKSKTPHLIYFIFLCIIFTFAFSKDIHFSLYYNKLGSSFILFLLYTTSEIFLLISIFKYISQKDNVIFGIFRNISRNALIILGVHFFYAFWFDKLFHANYYFKLFFVMICTIISIPIFRCYLYKLIGKEKITIKESLSIK